MWKKQGLEQVDKKGGKGKMGQGHRMGGKVLNGGSEKNFRRRNDGNKGSTTACLKTCRKEKIIVWNEHPTAKKIERIPFLAKYSHNGLHKERWHHGTRGKLTGSQGGGPESIANVIQKSMISESQ